MSLEHPESRAIPEFPLREAHCHVAACGRGLWMLDLAGTPPAPWVLSGLSDKRWRGDDHDHPLWRMPRAYECDSPFEMVTAVGRWVAELAGCGYPDTPVLAHGARPDAWDPSTWPELRQLDHVVSQRPCVVWCFDYHALMANSVALRLAGIDEHTPDPPDGVIGRDAEGRLTGVVYEAAAGQVWNAVVDESEPALWEARRGGATLDSTFAEIHDLKAQPWLGPVLAHPRTKLNARFVLWPLLDHADEVLETRAQWESERVRLGGFKIFTDGTLNSRTALMLHDYADGRPEHPRGVAMMSPKQIEDAVRKADALGYPIAAHAIGDGAVRAVLDAVERVRPKARGIRIEHAEVIDEADVPRFAPLGVIASVQPCHLLPDIEALRRAVPHRLDRVLPVRELIDSGLVPGETLLFGSDAPIVRADPRDSVWAATRRRRPDMDPREAIAPEQAITEAEAWECFHAG